MTLLDRFRGQPEWQHDDPSVRASAVDSLEDNAQELFLLIATEDTDPGVRAAAVVRLSDPAALARVTRSDRDEEVRTEAAAILRDMAIDNADPAAAAGALSGLFEQRDLSDVARTARLEATSLAALDRLDAQKTIGAVSRRSEHASVRVAALARIVDRSELLAVAVKSAHRDVALAAFDRLALGGDNDRGELKTIAARARSKPVARRARVALAALDAEPAAPPPDDSQRQRERLCDTVEALANVGDWDLVSRGIDDAGRQWRALDAVRQHQGAGDTPGDGNDGDVPDGADVEDAALTDRWTAAVARAGEQLSRLDAMRSEAERLRQQQAEAAARASQRDEQSAVEQLARLTTLTTALEEIAASAPLGELVQRWAAPHTEWRELTRAVAPELAAGLSTRVAAAEAKHAERLTAERDARQRRERATLARRQRRCDELEQAVADESLQLKDVERHLRTARSLLGNLGRVPTREDREALTARLRQAQIGLTGRIRELRGLAEWKQWANLGVQTALCQRLEALTSVEDDAAVAKEYREVMLAWRQVSEVQRGEGDEVFQRFKAAHDAIRPKADAYLGQQAVHRQESFDRKVALCEEAERLAESTDWIATAQRMTELQAMWKEIGPAPRKQEREVWNRFRAAGSRFFKRRREDLVERKQVWAKNAGLKDELCRKAEALSEEKDLAAAQEGIRQLAAEWKGVGPVRRNRSETLWKRFRAACDAVQTRAREAVDAEFADKVSARAAVCERLEALAPESAAESKESAAGVVPEPAAESEESAAGVVPAPAVESEETTAEAPDDLAAQVAAARTEWRQLPAVPQPQDRSLSARFQAALSRVVVRFPDAFRGTDLDPGRNRAALERLCERVEELVGEAAPAAAAARSPAELLAAQLREALANNTMGVKVDPEAQRRAAVEEVKRIQIQRRAVGVVPGDTGRHLSTRFRTACDRFYEQHPAPERPARPHGEDGPRRGRPRGRP